MKKIYNFKSTLTLILLITFSSFVSANDVPTVDDVNKQVPQLPDKKKETTEKLNELNKEVLSLDESKILKVLVKDFKLEGNKRYNDETLKNLFKESINKELDYNALLGVTTLISNYYRSNGFLATSYLPPQDIKNGIVQIKITEAELGKIIFDVDNAHELNLSEEKIRKKILYKVKDDGGLNISQLDKNIRNFNKTPGINAIAQLEEGELFGETDIVITANNTETITGSSLIDNSGSRASGTAKLTNTINVDGLFNIGDRFTFTNVATGNTFQSGKQIEESNYYAVASTFPIGYNGMQANMRISKMEYKLSAPYDSTIPSGYSTEYNFTLTRPLIEKLTKNLNATLAISRNDYVNDLGTGNNSNKDMTKASLNLGFDSSDTKLGGGVNYGLFGVTLGKLDVTDNATNFTTDQGTADNNGRNLKATFNFNRLQNVTDKTNMLLKFNSQFAADNLDGGEQFTLGGLNGVRAYSSSEAAGDAGFTTGIEVRRDLYNFPTTIFYDYGKIRLHKNRWTGWNSTNTDLKNTYALKGWGMTIDVPVFDLFEVKLTHSRTIQGNSGADSDGLDIDGLSWDDRTFISLTKNY